MGCNQDMWSSRLSDLRTATPHRRFLILCVGTTITAIAMVLLPDYPTLITIGVAGAFLLSLLHPDARSLVINVTPDPSWVYWLHMSVVLGMIVVIFSSVAYVFLRILSIEIPLPRFEPTFGNVSHYLLHGCLLAPVSEELIYRHVLCIGLFPIAGGWATVVISTS